MSTRKKTLSFRDRYKKCLTWIRRVVIRELSYTGILFALLFFAMSLTPSLLPRTWLFQGIASGLSLISGYAVGCMCVFVWRLMHLPELKDTGLRIAKGITGFGVTVQLAYVLFHTGVWQNTVRQLVGMEPAESSHLIRVTCLALVLGFVILLISRIIRYLFRRLKRHSSKYVSPRVASVIALIVVSWFFGSIVAGTFTDNALRIANNAFSVLDRSIKDGSIQPTSSLRSGGPESEVSWDSLGRQGKAFVGSGPTAEDIKRFDDNAKEPIRIYTGLQNGDTHEQRAEMALRELIRTDAFTRKVVLIATTTGTGYLDPNAVDTFEYIQGGDTAIVSMQYSYLPSGLALLSDTESAKLASIALFNEVHNYWQKLDQDTRPDLYLYGLSLGAYGSQASISRVEVLNDPVDGALWVGPPFVSEFWSRTTQNRDEGSPEWLPVYQEGRVIRFTGPENSLYEPTAEWQDNKIIYVQNATDPVVFFHTDYIWQKPDWLNGERGPGVTDDMNFYPVVTFWQLATDFLGSASTPEDFGHLYSKSTYIESWAALTEPAGWNLEREEALKSLVD